MKRVAAMVALRVRPRADGRPLFLAIAAAFALVWVYIALRAYQVAFTTDEAVSFGIFHGSRFAAGTANNHLLNTVLMQWSQDVFGESELALRLPNVLAFGLYAMGSLMFLSSLRRRAAVLLGAALLLADPFLLDFFGLARGYGLSLGFLAVALGALAMPRGSWWRPVVVCNGVVLAFYASFASLNLALGVLAALAVEAGTVWRRGSLRARAAWLMSIAAAVGLLVPGVIRLSWLERIHALYYGGHSGFVTDTVGSLIQGVAYEYTHGASYGAPRPGWLIWPELAVIAAAALACASTCYVGVSRRRWGPSQQLTVVLLVAIAAIEVEAKTVGTLFPVDRTALGYVLVFALVIAGAADEIAVSFARRTIARPLALIAAATAAAAAANVAGHANLTYTPAWSHDASARSVADDVIAFARTHPEDRPLRLLSVPTDYALTYYRLRFHLTWLHVPSGAGAWRIPEADLYEVSPDRVSHLSPGSRLLDRFPETDSELRARFPLPQEHVSDLRLREL